MKQSKIKLNHKAKPQTMSLKILMHKSQNNKWWVKEI